MTTPLDHIVAAQGLRAVLRDLVDLAYHRATVAARDFHDDDLADTWDAIAADLSDIAERKEIP